MWQVWPYDNIRRFLIREPVLGMLMTSYIGGLKMVWLHCYAQCKQWTSWHTVYRSMCTLWSVVSNRIIWINPQWLRPPIWMLSIIKICNIDDCETVQAGAECERTEICSPGDGYYRNQLKEVSETLSTSLHKLSRNLVQENEILCSICRKALQILPS